ncbi:MAG: hypothetical protein GF375_00200 [Candidatus Omnitrophica bacterium]|nr:hypothetical protein [Candidatus Omnitrophota bacterium]MBD3268590.1 hypothetical protein [Candidatus Omnitrophota bacterium]
MNNQRPLGVTILGGFNLFILGGLSLLALGYVYFNFSSLTEGNFLNEFKQHFPQNVEIDARQLRSAIALQMLVSAVFLVSGAGLLLRKEWARKLTLYFSFFIAVLTFISVVATPALISRAFLQIIYPGILIIYFTNNKIENYFSCPRNAEKKDSNTGEQD